MVRHTYSLTNEVGEVRTITGIRNVANFLDVAVSTVCKYAKNGRLWKGWKIDETLVSDSGDMIVEVVEEVKTKRPRNRYIDKGWNFNKFFVDGNVCCVAKSYLFDYDETFDFKQLKSYLEFMVKSYVENEDRFDDKHILYIKTPNLKYSRNNREFIKKQILYFELHIKFMEHLKFPEEIEILKEYTNKIDKLINSYENYYRDLERQGC